ncbi:MAG: class I SAM-dependent methyltransferase [Bacteroidetes bacterium]|nr:class I SAM-dependent methyltransferase [Bacteroidota bacterium]
MKNKNFKLYSQYYDLIYQEKDYSKEIDYIFNLINKFGKGGKIHLLDLGSGTGNHGYLMAEKGFEVTGIEKSSEMVAISNKRNHRNFKSYIGDIVSFSLPEKFNVITALFHVISYINNNHDLDKMLNNVYTHLETDGIFIFDVWYSPAVYTLKPETRIKRIISENIELTRIAEPVLHSIKNIVDVNYQIIIKDTNSGELQEFKELHPMRHFTIPEVELYAEKHNFEIILTEEFMTGKTPSENTWGVNFILRKN